MNQLASKISPQQYINNFFTPPAQILFASEIAGSGKSIGLAWGGKIPWAPWLRDAETLCFEKNSSKRLIVRSAFGVLSVLGSVYFNLVPIYPFLTVYIN